MSQSTVVKREALNGSFHFISLVPLKSIIVDSVHSALVCIYHLSVFAFCVNIKQQTHIEQAHVMLEFN